VDRVRMTPAGTAGGTAMVCGMLGLRGQLVSQVGMDDAGDFLIGKLEHCNVSTATISRNNDGIQTSCSVLPIRASAARSAYFCQGTASSLSLDDLDLNAVLKARIVHLGGTGLLPRLDGPPSLRLLQRAKELGRVTVFDLILADSDTMTLVEPLLPCIDYFCPSIEEAAALAGCEGAGACRSAPMIAKVFKERGVKNVILTMDKDGAYIDPEVGKPFSLAAHDIEVVDTTGCGDSFTAGVIVGLAKGWDLRRAAAFGNAVAAQVALGLGSDGDGSLKSVEGTLRFMETTPLRAQLYIA